MQTSIEWFIEHLLGSGLLRLTKEEHKLYSELRDKAKEMHKQQIINAHKNGYLIGEYLISDKDAKKVAEKYYQETFKKD
jgi:hypothetical protein